MKNVRAIKIYLDQRDPLEMDILRLYDECLSGRKQELLRKMIVDGYRMNFFVDKVDHKVDHAGGNHKNRGSDVAIGFTTKNNDDQCGTINASKSKVYLEKIFGH